MLEPHGIGDVEMFYTRSKAHASLHVITNGGFDEPVYEISDTYCIAAKPRLMEITKPVCLTFG